MENSDVKLSVHCGYKITSKTETVDLCTAYDLLSSKRQRKYTKALKEGNTVKIIRHVIRCPFCGKEIPAYSHFIYEEAWASEKIPSGEISVWTEKQIALFDNKNKVIYFQIPDDFEETYFCEKCCQTSRKSDEMSEVLISYENKCIKVSRRINSIKNLMKIKWLDTATFNGDLPLFEKVCFDFDLRETRLLLTDENDNVICSKRLTKTMVEEEASVLIEFISKNNAVRRNLKRMFEKHCDNGIELLNTKASFEQFLVLTQFSGFDETFFTAIPYERNSYAIESTFEEIALQLKNPDCAMEKLKKSTLPDIKSIKRIFAKNQGLFFYIKECEILFDVLKNENLFVRILSCDDVYSILSDLHRYRGYVCFYKDFCEVSKPNVLCNMLIANHKHVNKYAKEYCALSEEMRNKYIHQMSVRNRRVNDNPLSETYFSMPMKQMPDYIKDCVIGKFSFRNLKTRNDYLVVANILGNCLSRWCSCDNPVAVVCKGNKIMAAIEVEGDKVIQARGEGNERINQDTGLYRAVEKWCEKFDLVWEYNEI